MSFLDCTCISSHSQVQPISIEEQYEDISRQCSSSDVSPCSVLTDEDDITDLSTNPAHYQLLSQLGRGFNNLSQVSMARHTPSGRLVAVKNTNLDECTEDELLQLMNEVLRSRLFRHPNLLTSRLVFSSCCQLWVLSPLMSYGSADSLLRSYFPDGMSESLIAYLLYGVLRALEYLHHMGYVHRGVKASHVLLSAEGRVCLSGLQSVYSLMKDGKRMRAVFDMPQHSPSLLPWLSPELLRQDLHGYGVKSDIYSLGIVVCELVSGRVPFQDMPPTLCERVYVCWPSATALLTHPFFRQVKKHTRDSFLSLMYPAVPVSCPPGTPPSETPTQTCNAPSPTEPEDGMWDFS
ncbi:STE20-related kinase adapter protein beta [Sinocyclocheilus grahami]|uniref:STE20-related kinase adapter protein beta n=1 Tax=Sinocyclocheilus grahami TaxID=75366 RepID=UPI0007AD3527|nr:PREDICTED: STE20-related kinase adapter protein beta-like [Sinocyclocheilus grahami]